MINSDSDDSDWADLASELGLESKKPIKPAYSAPAEIEATQTQVEPPPFPDVPWPADPNPTAVDAGIGAEFSDLPDAEESHDELDTMLDPLLAGEEFAPEMEESAVGESEVEGSGTGKRRRRRRRRRKGGPGEPGEGAEGAEVDAEGEVEPVVPVEPRTTADAIRDLVKSWTVPNWNEIVAGLYRPGGGDR